MEELRTNYSRNKRTIYLIGSSHANRLYKSIIRSSKYNKRFNVKNYCKPGATFNNTPKPHPALFCNRDIIIVQSFGNSIFRKSETTSDPVLREFQLKSFSPTDEQELLKEWNSAKTYFDEALKKGTKIYLIDNPIRYINNTDKRVIAHQKKLNSKLRDFFTQVCVINHRKLLPLSGRGSKNNHQYRTMIGDGVHFHLEVYKHMINVLFENYLKN